MTRHDMALRTTDDRALTTNTAPASSLMRCDAMCDDEPCEKKREEIIDTIPLSGRSLVSFCSGVLSFFLSFRIMTLGVGVMLAGVLAIRSFRRVSGGNVRSLLLLSRRPWLGRVGSFGRDNGRICVGSFPGCLQTFFYLTFPLSLPPPVFFLFFRVFYH